MKLSEMLNEYLVWLDDEDGDSPFPEWMHNSDWVSLIDGGCEDWGQHLLRLSATEVAKLEEENAAIKHKLGLCEMALRVGHLPLPPYDDEQEPE